MKYPSIRSAASKSAITPSRIGLMAAIEPGVRPTIALASVPTASIRSFTVLKATIDGSLRTIPCPRAKTQVLAVPRSIARSLAKIANVPSSMRDRLGNCHARLAPAELRAASHGCTPRRQAHEAKRHTGIAAA